MWCFQLSGCRIFIKFLLYCKHLKACGVGWHHRRVGGSIVCLSPNIQHIHAYKTRSVDEVNVGVDNTNKEIERITFFFFFYIKPESK